MQNAKISRIDIFMPPKSRYGVLQHMTRDIYEAFLRAGIHCRLLVADYNNPKPFLESLFNDPPQCTLSLNGLLPDANGKFFCDMIQVPHIAWLLDSQNQFTPLTATKRNIITCPDVYATHFFKGLNFDNVLFLPHGVGKDAAFSEQEEKIYDVVFLGSYINYETIEKDWKEKYPKNLYTALMEAAEITLSDEATPYVEAFVQSLNKHLSKTETLESGPLQVMQVLDDLEMYVRGVERVRLIQAVKDVNVHIFGTTDDKGGSWKKSLGKDSEHVVFHAPVPFEDALNVMRKSKIVLNSCPWIKNGAHERILAAMVSGALPLTSKNPYMASHFTDGKDIAYYSHGKWDSINDLINGYLSDSKKREDVVRSGREKALGNHTWDHRVSALLSALPGMLRNTQK